MSEADNLLSEALDLCARARQMEAMDRREAHLADSFVAQSMTVPFWLEEQYQRDLLDWEKRARAYLERWLLSPDALQEPKR